MKIFGSITELVSAVFRKNGQTITTRPNQATTYTTSTDVQLPPSAAASQVLVSEAATQTLTNKSIDADTNTITNIENADIKAGAAIDATKIADGSVNNTAFQRLATIPTGTVLTDSSTATLTNKTIDGDDNTVQDLPLTALKTVVGLANRVIRRDASGVVISDNIIPNSSALVTSDSTQTLTNKTITGAANSLSQIGIASLDGVLADANKVLRRDAAGAVVSGNTLPNSSAIVTTDATQVLTNKDIDGGTASNSSRITVPKAAKATLDALTRKQGTIVYDTDSNKFYSDNGTTLVAIGSGSGSGELNTITNPSAADDTQGWATSGAITLTRENPTGFLLNSVIPTGFLIQTNAPGNYVYTRFTMPVALKTASALKIAFYQSTMLGLKLDLYTNTASNYSGSYTRVALESDVASVTNLTNTTGLFKTKFTPDSSDYYELRFTSTTGSIVSRFTDLIVGPTDATLVGDFVQASQPADTSGPATDGSSTFNIVSISLDPGTWSLSGLVGWTRGPGTFNYNLLTGGFSTTSATLPDSRYTPIVKVPTATPTDLVATAIPTYEITVASTTTIYLVSQIQLSASSATIYGYGYIQARKVA